MIYNNKNVTKSFLTRRASSCGPGVPFKTLQAESFFNFDFGFVADHSQFFSHFLFFEAPHQPHFH